MYGWYSLCHCAAFTVAARSSGVPMRHGSLPKDIDGDIAAIIALRVRYFCLTTFVSRSGIIRPPTMSG